MILSSVIFVGAAAAQPDAKGPARRLAAATLIPNGSFESSLVGWSTWNASLSLVSSGSDGLRSARVSAQRRVRAFAISSSPNPVTSSGAGEVYRVQASVRTEKTGRETCLRLREWAGSSVVESSQSCIVTTAAWQRFPIVSLTARADGHEISVDVFVPDASSGDTFLADDIVLSGQTTPALAPAPAPLPPAAACTLYADPAGSDTAAGSATAPLRTAQALVGRLSAGQTGCLQPGTYTENLTIRTGGSPGAPITLTSAAAPAKLLGRLWVADSANDVVISKLVLDGRTVAPPSPTVNGDRIAFLDNEVTNGDTNICFVIGDGEGPYGIAVDTVIERNRIHNCGKLPATNHHHGIYVEASRGARIVGNAIYDNADRGIQLYPDAQGSFIAGNVLDGNGSGIIFSGDFGKASSNTVVRGNVISNSILRANIESWYPAGNPVGVSNLVESNCVWNGAGGNIDGSTGFTARANVIADPLFLNRAAKDFRLASASPCAPLLAG